LGSAAANDVNEFHSLAALDSHDLLYFRHFFFFFFFFSITLFIFSLSFSKPASIKARA
jgi:hypothetical protein